jgi:hypothetical protein
MQYGAIILAGLLVAASVAVTSGKTGADDPVSWRIDRWTGSVSVCTRSSGGSPLAVGKWAGPPRSGKRRPLVARYAWPAGASANPHDLQSTLEFHAASTTLSAL